MVSGVLITVASRGSPSSAVCTLCLQRRRDACEPRSRGTQGVLVYTSTSTACLWPASTPGSIHATRCHACHAMPCRNGMPVSIVGLASCSLTSQSAIDSNAILSKSATSDLPPFFACSRCCQLDSDQVSYILTTYSTYQVPTTRLPYCTISSPPCP